MKISIEGSSVGLGYSRSRPVQCVAVLVLRNYLFQSFAGFWYPADKICISLVYIIGTNIETKEKKCRTSIHRTESRHIHLRACSSVI